jgi:hypothetical protein
MSNILAPSAMASAGNSAPPRLFTARGVAGGAALALLSIVSWCLTHRYRGLTGDSELYAVQALSRIHAGLMRDVFLGNASQDRYTLFSPIYALCIEALGLPTAALSLLLVFKLCFYCSAWMFSRKLFDTRIALLTTALLIVTPMEYGAYHVFHVGEDMLTARSLAETLAMVALCLHVYGRRALGLAAAILALSIHALMALPAVLLMLALRMRIRTSLLCALSVIALVLCGASAAARLPDWTPPFLAVMDPSWLEVVRERSQFVFLQLWGLDDWELNARPFLSLGLSMLAVPDDRIRSLCGNAIIVGAAGLAIAFIAATIGPASILLQGQAWRWVWVTSLASLLMLAPTVRHMWSSMPCGPLCVLLLLVGWLVPSIDGSYCIAASLSLWYGRKHIAPTGAPYVHFVALAFGALVLARVIGIEWHAARPPAADMGSENGILRLARTVFGLDGVPVGFAFLVGLGVLRSRSLALRGAITLALGTATAFAVPDALRDPRPEGSAAQLEEFSDWREAIPPGENVFVAPSYYSASFAWFTLERPSYLTVDQSSGVIFSRATAAEIRRRSLVLLPIQESDWRLLSRRASHGGKFDASALPLTRDRLVRICGDPELSFVIAKEDVGFTPLHHSRSGTWNGWNLYDCRQVNQGRIGNEHDE